MIDMIDVSVGRNPTKQAGRDQHSARNTTGVANLTSTAYRPSTSPLVCEGIRQCTGARMPIWQS